jgi:transcriptional regulator with XRE-family HTH domain
LLFQMPRKAAPSLARRLGARIRELREAAGFTQERLAWDCELDKGYLSQVEAGKRMPSLPVLFDLAKQLQLEVADFVGFDLEHPRLRLLDAARRNDVGELARLLERLRGTS